MLKIINFFQKKNQYVTEKSKGIIRLWYSTKNPNQKLIKEINTLKSLGYMIEKKKFNEISYFKIYAKDNPLPEDCA